MTPQEIELAYNRLALLHSETMLDNSRLRKKLQIIESFISDVQARLADVEDSDDQIMAIRRWE